ncbi:malectin domain-containing carbohydrate-binding protein [Pricia sp. S334]|uniref:Malectin domain-containing carbohydrate-binding protein n=1 Tax=Pricia mediterranea TaxID=3076079 RepID=A0ABU3L7V0_9FLAO|nr:invasin domain 3-containing protein [Pricia sp. S334]MDT7829825.1 malectin domain-containing carbohydrate-binding protein [Pricia sp. S334]
MKLKFFKRYFLFASLIASFAMLPAACSSDDGGDEPPVVVATPDPANPNTTITAESPVTADGTATSKVTVKIADTDGKPIANSAGKVVLTATGSANVSDVTDNKNGSYSATVTNTVAETVTISGALDGKAITDKAEIVFEAAAIVAGDPDPTNENTTLTSTAPTNENGVSTAEVTVQLADADGILLAVSGGTVTLTATGSATLTDAGVVDNEDGTYTAIFENSVQENVTISGALDGVAITSTTDITFNPEDANPAIEGVQQTPEAEIQGPSLIRINSGGPEVTLDGKVFLADQYFDTENTVAYTNPNVTDIAGTESDSLYLTERITKDGTSIRGPFSYNIPVTNGTYTVKLYFAEIYWGLENPEGFEGDIGKRIFNVSMEDTQIFAGYDLVKDVNPATASSRMYDIEVTDGVLNITFEASVNKPKISGIEVFGTGTVGDM